MATQPGNKHTTQNILNWSFDSDFSILAVSMLGYDGSNLVRLKTNTSGELIANLESDAGLQCNDVDDYTTANTTYVGLEDKDGVWCIKKLDETGNFLVITYATITNNPTLTSFSTAWSARTTATYNVFSTAF